MGIDDPTRIKVVAVQALGRHLHVQRVGYGQVNADDATIVLDTCFAEGLDPLVGTFRLDDFGKQAIDRQRRGSIETCDDVALDPELGPGTLVLDRHARFRVDPADPRRPAARIAVRQRPRRTPLDERRGGADQRCRRADLGRDGAGPCRTTDRRRDRAAQAHVRTGADLHGDAARPRAPLRVRQPGLSAVDRPSRHRRSDDGGGATRRGRAGLSRAPRPGVRERRGVHGDRGALRPADRARRTGRRSGFVDFVYQPVTDRRGRGGRHLRAGRRRDRPCARRGRAARQRVEPARPQHGPRTPGHRTFAGAGADVAADARPDGLAQRGGVLRDVEPGVADRGSAGPKRRSRRRRSSS